MASIKYTALAIALVMGFAAVPAFADDPPPANGADSQPGAANPAPKKQRRLGQRMHKRLGKLRARKNGKKRAQNSGQNQPPADAAPQGN